MAEKEFAKILKPLFKSLQEKVSAVVEQELEDLRVVAAKQTRPDPRSGQGPPNCERRPRESEGNYGWAEVRSGGFAGT